MNRYTVIGFYADNGQRWADAIEAASPEEAEHKVSEDIHVVGVIEGEHVMADSYGYVRMGGES